MTLLFSNKNILHILCVAIMIVFCFGAVNSVFAQIGNGDGTNQTVNADGSVTVGGTSNNQPAVVGNGSAGQSNAPVFGNGSTNQSNAPIFGNGTGGTTNASQNGGPSGNITSINSNGTVSVQVDPQTANKLRGGGGGGSGAYQTITPGGFPGSGASGGFGGILRTLFTWGVTLAALLAVTMLIVGGIEYMGSDSIFAKDQGRKRIASALGGLLIALTCVLLLGVILGFGGGGGSGGSFDVNLDF